MVVMNGRLARASYAGNGVVRVQKPPAAAQTQALASVSLPLCRRLLRRRPRLLMRTRTRGGATQSWLTS
jgi:hypothetical protein